MGLFNKFKKNVLSSEERRQLSNQKIKKLGIACLEGLPIREDSSHLKLKSFDEICERAVACLIVIQLACDINNGEDYEKSKEFVVETLDNFGVGDKLLPKERRLLDGTYSRQDVIDVAWTYECYWSLVWALKLVNKIDMPDNICDCDRAIALVSMCKTMEEFKKGCKLRDIEEILDMYDLYFRYHWACEEKRLRPETNIGPLNPEVVMERRRGLEWLVSEETDWDEISLDT